jgi:hypothetical protein
VWFPVPTIEMANVSADVPSPMDVNNKVVRRRTEFINGNATSEDDKTQV